MITRLLFYIIAIIMTAIGAMQLTACATKKPKTHIFGKNHVIHADSITVISRDTIYNVRYVPHVRSFTVERSTDTATLIGEPVVEHSEIKDIPCKGVQPLKVPYTTSVDPIQPQRGDFWYDGTFYYYIDHAGKKFTLRDTLVPDTIKIPIEYRKPKPLSFTLEFRYPDPIPVVCVKCYKQEEREQYLPVPLHHQYEPSPPIHFDDSMIYRYNVRDCFPGIDSLLKDAGK